MSTLGQGDPRWPEALTNILRVECSNDQQEGPRLPVEGGDGEVRRLIPETQGTHSSASGHRGPGQVAS